MSSLEKHPLSSLLTNPFLQLNPPKDIILSFLKDIYHTIMKRSNGKFNFYILQELIDIPLIIIEKIFNLINTDNTNILSLSNFTNGLYDLLFSEYSEKKISFLFDLLDFDKDGFILKCDVFLLLSHFHLFQNTDETVPQLELIIDNFFFTKRKMSKSDFISISTTDNSDIIMLLHLYIRVYCCFFGESELMFYVNNSNNTYKSFDKVDSIYNTEQMMCYFKHSSLDLRKYLDIVKVNINHNVISSSEFEDSIELDDLRIFEHEVNEMFQLINPSLISLKFDVHAATTNEGDVRKNKTVSMKKAEFYKTNTSNSGPINISHIGNAVGGVGVGNQCSSFVSKKSEETTTISSLFPCSYNKIKTISDTNDINNVTTNNNLNLTNTNHSHYLHLNFHSHSHSHNNTFIKSATCTNNNNKPLFPSNPQSNELYCFKSKNNVKTNIIIKLKLIGAFIFYFKLQNNVFIFKKIIPIFSLYPKKHKLYSSSNIQFSLKGTVFNYYKQYTFFTDNKSNVLDNFIHLMNTKNNVRDLTEQYEQKELLGKGKFGSVSLVEHKQTGKVYAVKTISKNTPIEEEYKINRWERSISVILSNINHINVIKCYDSFDNVSHSYFIYEYIKGSDLSVYAKDDLHKNNYTLSKRVDIIMNISFQIIKGVGYLHKFGIIHRDIKHTNILIQTKTQLIKIIDFGLSRVIPKYEYSTDPYGSLCFKAPELILQLPYNFKVDIWAIGITLYYLMYKAFPFENENKEQIKRGIVHDNIEFKVISEYSVFSSVNGDHRHKEGNSTGNNCVNNEDTEEDNYEYNSKVNNTYTSYCGKSVNDHSDNGNVCVLYALISDCLEKNVRDRPDIKYIVEKYLERNVKVK